MDSDQEWEEKVVESLLPEEEQKEEKKYPHKLPLKMTKLKSLNKEIQFLRILKKRKINNKYFIIYFGKDIIDNKNINKYLNISFVTKKKIGNAVVRNKIKRKLKSAIQKILKEKKLIDLSYTYLIFGKNNVYKDKFSNIFSEVNETFKKIKNINKKIWNWWAIF